MEDYAGDQLRPPRGGQIEGREEKADPSLHSGGQACKSSAEEVAVFLEIGPGDRAIWELHSDAEALVGQLLTVNHFPEGLIRVQRSNAHYVTGLPGVLREYAGAVRADVIGKGPLSIASRAGQRR